MDENIFEEKAKELIKQTKDAINNNLDEKVQSELAELISLIQYLRKGQYYNLIGPLEIAIFSLLKEQPALELASQIRADINRQIRRSRSLFGGILFSGTPPTRVILGLGMLLYLAIPIMIMILTIPGEVPEIILGIPVDILLMVGLAGALGSIVSIMVRIADFSSLENADPSVLFFTGFFKPVVGAAFALFIFAVLKAGLIPITVQPETEQYFFMALSFVSGFSERFAKDVASKIENKIGGNT